MTDYMQLIRDLLGGSEFAGMGTIPPTGGLGSSPWSGVSPAGMSRRVNIPGIRPNMVDIPGITNDLGLESAPPRTPSGGIPGSRPLNPGQSPQIPGKWGPMGPRKPLPRGPNQPIPPPSAPNPAPMGLGETPLGTNLQNMPVMRSSPMAIGGPDNIQWVGDQMHSPASLQEALLRQINAERPQIPAESPPIGLMRPPISSGETVVPSASGVFEPRGAGYGPSGGVRPGNLPGVPQTGPGNAIGEALPTPGYYAPRPGVGGVRPGFAPEMPMLGAGSPPAPPSLPPEVPSGGPGPGPGSGIPGANLPLMLRGLMGLGVGVGAVDTKRMLEQGRFQDALAVGLPTGAALASAGGATLGTLGTGLAGLPGFLLAAIGRSNDLGDGTISGLPDDHPDKRAMLAQEATDRAVNSAMESYGVIRPGVDAPGEMLNPEFFGGPPAPAPRPAPRRAPAQAPAPAPKMPSPEVGPLSGKFPAWGQLQREIGDFAPRRRPLLPDPNAASEVSSPDAEQSLMDLELLKQLKRQMGGAVTPGFRGRGPDTLPY